MQCTQHTVGDVPADSESIYLTITPYSGDSTHTVSELSLKTLLDRFVGTVEELTIVNSRTDIRLTDTSILGTMPRLSYLNIDTDTPIVLESLRDCTSLDEVYLYGCTVDIKELPSSVSSLYMEKCDCNLESIAAAIPKLYSLVLKDMSVGQLPDMTGLDRLSLLKIVDCTVTGVHESVYSLGLEVLEIVHHVNGTDTPQVLVLKGSLSSQNIDSIVLYGNIQADSLTIEHRPSNILIKDNIVISRPPTMKKGTELMDVRRCPNIKIYAADLYNNVDRLVVDSHKYLNADDDYRLPIQIVSD